VTVNWLLIAQLFTKADDDGRKLKAKQMKLPRPLAYCPCSRTPKGLCKFPRPLQQILFVLFAHESPRGESLYSQFGVQENPIPEETSKPQSTKNKKLKIKSL